MMQVASNMQSLVDRFVLDDTGAGMSERSIRPKNRSLSGKLPV